MDDGVADVNSPIDFLEIKTVDWDDGHRFGEHRTYSSIDNTDSENSRRILFVLIGEDCEEVFTNEITPPDNSNVEKEFSKIIGTDFMQKYSECENKLGLEKGAISFDLIFARKPEMLEDKLPTDYFAIFLLDTTEHFDFESVFNWLKSDTQYNNQSIPLIFSLSNKISKRISIQKEEVLSKIAKSWLIYNDEISPSQQLDISFLAMKNLFFENHDGSILELCRDIIQDMGILPIDKSKQYSSDSESHNKFCKNLISIGNIELDQNIIRIIKEHIKNFKMARKANLPNEFISNHPNIRNGRDAWCRKIVSTAQKDYSEGIMKEELFAIDAIHEFHPSNRRKTMEKEGKYEQLVEDYVAEHRHSGKEPNFETRFNNGAHASRNLYGTRLNEKIEYNRWHKVFDDLKIISKLLDHQGLSRNMHPKFFSNFRRLFQITDMWEYEQEAGKGMMDKLDPNQVKMISVSKIKIIQKRISDLLLQDWLLSFKQQGGWCK